MEMFPSRMLADIDSRVNALIEKMTLSEKVGQMMLLSAVDEKFVNNFEDWCIGAYFHSDIDKSKDLQNRAAKTRLGIPILFAEDAIHGHCFEDNATVFPTQLGMSCSWDRSLLNKVGKITAREARACGVHWIYSPVLCLGRDTRWGRVNETFGEDPYLSGVLSAELITAYQGDDLSSDDSVMACAKHFVAYGDALGGRDSYEATVSKRQLLSTFLPPFEKAVKESNVASLMAGYHAIDGLPCSANKWLLQDVAKEAWEMEGFIVTDYNNVGAMHELQKVAGDLKEAAYISIVAGNDMIMNTPSFFEHAVALVGEGRIDESRIDESVARILRYKFKLGLFDGKADIDYEKRSSIVGQQDHWQAALESSRSSITLLTNNNLLPLDQSAISKVLLLGGNADDRVAQLGDWSFGPNSKHLDYHQDQTVTLYQAMCSLASSHDFTLDYVQGAACVDEQFDEIEKARKSAADADVIVACVGDTLSENGEFHDRANLELSGKQQALLEAMKATGKKLVVVYMASKPLAISWIKQHADALICAFNPGAKGGTAIAEALFGEFNPSGKLTISFPHSAGQLPVYYNRYEGWHSRLCDTMPGEERYFDLPEDPLFAFGHGLSYTSFTYNDLHLSAAELKLGEMEKLTVTVTVINSGSRAGSEVTQLYINDVVSSVTTPVMELKGFVKNDLEVAESRQLTFELDLDALSLVNNELERIVENGDFEVLVGGSSRRDELLIQRFNVTR